MIPLRAGLKCVIPTIAIAAFVANPALLPSASVSPEKANHQSATRQAPLKLGSQYVDVAIDAQSALFTMATLEGDPDNPDDDNEVLLFGHPDPWSSGTTFRVDGNDLFTYDDSSDGINAITQPPANDPGEFNATVWEYQGVRFTQVLKIVEGSNSGLRDTLLIEYSAENIDSAPHDVGIRLFLDTQLGGNDGAPFQVPGLGSVTEERELSAPNIPQSWQAFDDLGNPSVVSAGTLIGGQAVPPDRIAWGSWPSMNNTPWDYTVNPNSTFGDSAVLMWWNPITLNPGETRTVRTYYGLDRIDVNQEPPLVVGLSDPGRLTDDGTGSLTPNPFTITAFLENSILGRDLEGVYAEIILPQGLVLVEGETARHEIGTMPNGSNEQTSWQVRADGTASGDLEYCVEVGAVEEETKTVCSMINVPELCSGFAGPADGYEADFANGRQCWEFVGTSPVFDNPVHSIQSDALRLDANGSASAFGFWRSPKLDVDGGAVYMINYVIRSNASPQDAPNLRIRVNDASLRWSDFESFESVGTADGSPGPTPTQYTQYVFIPDYVNQMEIAYDLLSFQPADNTNAYFDLLFVSIDEMQAPTVQ